MMMMKQLMIILLKMVWIYSHKLEGSEHMPTMTAELEYLIVCWNTCSLSSLISSRAAKPEQK